MVIPVKLQLKEYIFFNKICILFFSCENTGAKNSFDYMVRILYM